MGLKIDITIVERNNNRKCKNKQTQSKNIWEKKSSNVFQEVVLLFTRRNDFFLRTADSGIVWHMKSTGENNGDTSWKHFCTESPWSVFRLQGFVGRTETWWHTFLSWLRCWHSWKNRSVGPISEERKQKDRPKATDSHFYLQTDDRNRRIQITLEFRKGRSEENFLWACPTNIRDNWFHYTRFHYTRFHRTTFLSESTPQCLTESRGDWPFSHAWPRDPFWIQRQMILVSMGYQHRATLVDRVHTSFHVFVVRADLCVTTPTIVCCWSTGWTTNLKGVSISQTLDWNWHWGCGMQKTKIFETNL